MRSFEFCLLGTVTLAFGLLLPSDSHGASADPFALTIRSTPWQSPADEQKSFHLPPGFEIQLVAAEPDINKPMNLAFDAKGRLWVSTSMEYPEPVSTNNLGRDRIMIFEDLGADGRARKVTQFAGGLNIPIGLYPFQSRNADGSTTWKAVAWSIPHIWLFEDTDGDGRSDRQETLYSNFDHTRDTHGNQASFRRGFDGWLYCTHGYNNDSHVKGRDGNEVHLNSGNTYRVRLDGSRIEHYTHGQVNPFGLAFDAFGNLFASDCHSEPLYQLLAGGYYPSFGKPHDGLGFAPKMMENKRGSTAIDGISLYADTLWPEEFRGNLFVGDVMTSRIYRDGIVEEGSTRRARGLPDLVTSDDPWFRPVDTQLGPDGALYIADFYNRIIGHYEVPFTHPGRDRSSGRIWRVVFRGTDRRNKPGDLHDLSKASVKDLVAELARPNLIRRRLASDELTDRLGKDSIAVLRKTIANPVNSFQHVHGLWVLRRLGALDESALSAAARDNDRLVRTHAMRLLAAMPEFRAPHRALAITGLADRDALVRRCAAEALGNHPEYENITLLLDLVQRVPLSDTHLLYVARQALRDQLIPEVNLRRLTSAQLDPKERAIIADLSLSVKTAAAGTFLIQQLAAANISRTNSTQTPEFLRHAARYAATNELSQLTAFASGPIPEGSGPPLFQELGRQFALFKSLDTGLQQRGWPLPESAQTWGGKLVRTFFKTYKPSREWRAFPHHSEPTETPWDTEPRVCSDGRSRQLMSSFPYGDELTGVLRSQPFEIPGRLEFWLCGHDGFPDNPPQHLNRIRLCEHPSGQVLAETFAPRDNAAHRIAWSLHEHRGKKAYVEAIDGDDSNEYAWIAFGDFQPMPPQLRPSEFTPRQTLEWMKPAAEIAVRTQLKDIAPVIGGFCVPGPEARLNEVDSDPIGALAQAWVMLAPEQAVPALSSVLNAGAGSLFYRESVAQILASQNRADAQKTVLTVMKTLPQRAQERLSYTLASAQFSAESLLLGIEGGFVSPRILQRVGVNNRLRASKPTHWEARVARLKSQLPPADDARDKLIVDYKTASTEKPGNPVQGRQVFGKSCAACHRIGTEGALIGPQLDGIGQRGLDRLCEDVLDPNRSVDQAFRTTVLTLKNGDVASGLFRREEGELLVLAESTGREITVPKSAVVERRESEVSLMPENLGETLSREDFSNLMAFLLSTALKQP